LSVKSGIDHFFILVLATQVILLAVLYRVNSTYKYCTPSYLQRILERNAIV